MKTKKNLFLLFFLLCIVLPSMAVSNPKIDPYLQAKMNESRGTDQLSIYIVFDSHLTLGDFSDLPYNMPRKERRLIVVERLKTFSENSQAGVREYLQSKLNSDKVGYYEALWINNTIRVSADVETINELATAFDRVNMLYYDYPYTPEELTDEQTKAPFQDALRPNSTINPGVILMNADDVWALGNTGEGVVIGNADDGFHWRHPDVVNNMYQNLGEDV